MSSQFRSVLIAFGTLAPLLAIYALLLWLSHQRRPEDEAQDPPDAPNTAAASWVAAPPPAVRRRVRAALARLTVTASPAEGGDGTKLAAGRDSGKGGELVDEEAVAVDTDALCVICLDGWDDTLAVMGGGGGGSGGDGRSGDGGGGGKKRAAAAARTRLPCGHSFHLSCILRWAIKAPRCPLCNDGALGEAAAAVDMDAVAPEDGGAASSPIPPALPAGVAAGGAPGARRQQHQFPFGGLGTAERVAVVSLAA
ncbi:hypothetical protein MMPV_003620 [Pyropia vietnamensis]